MENKLDRNKLTYKTGNEKRDNTYDLQKLKIRRPFGR